MLAVGATTTVLPVKEPGVQVKVMAPPAVKVAGVPAQMEVGDALAVMVGLGATTTLIVLVPMQPNVFVPVTVYTVVAEGVMATEKPTEAPGFQVNVAAPVADNVAEFPAQTDVVGIFVATIFGTLTVTDTVLVFVHPRSLPVTE